MRVLFLTFTLLVSGAFAQDISDALNRAITNKSVALAVQAKMKEGFRLKQNTATLISHSFGDEGYSDQYIVSFSFEKGKTPIDKQTELVTVFVNTDTYGEVVTLLDTGKMSKAVRKSLEPEDENSVVQKFFTNLVYSKTDLELEDIIMNLEVSGYKNFGLAQSVLLEGMCGVAGCDNHYLVTIYVSTTKANPMTTTIGAIITSNVLTGRLEVLKMLDSEIANNLLGL